VGVVVPAYNAERYLGAALRSLAEQSYGDWEAVVVDDGSADATAEVAAEAARQDGRVQVLSQSNGGVSAARNRGISALAGSGAEYMCFLDSDDALLPCAFTILTGALESTPGAVGAHGLAEYMDDKGQPVAPGVHGSLMANRSTFAPRRQGAPGPDDGAARWLRGRPLSAGEATTFDSLAIYGSIWPPATALVRYSAAAEVGGFDASFGYMEDWDFFLRVSRLGDFAYVDRQVAWYRRHPGNARAASGPGHGAEPLGGWDASFRVAVAAVRYRAWSSPANTPAQRRALCRANVREAAGLARRQLGQLGADLSRRRWAGARKDLGWSAYALWQLAGVRPVKPRPKLLRALDRW
jgi:glycosyltransferase involved in cell wall biosynthesis